MTFDEFMAEPRLKNAYVEERGFKHLYVRKGIRRLPGDEIVTTIDLAKLETKRKGKGTFTRFIARLRKDYPTYPIYVESVLNERLPGKLLSLGFHLMPNSDPPSYYVR
jgi:hypothetical protein